MYRKGEQTYLKISKKWHLKKVTQLLQDTSNDINKPRTKKRKDIIMEYSKNVLRKYNPKYRK